MVKTISAQPLAFMGVGLALEFVGAQQRRDHVAGDEERGRCVDQLDDHQILRKPTA
jgi:hypothetical protein